MPSPHPLHPANTQLDERSEVRRPHENPQIQKLYENWLGKVRVLTVCCVRGARVCRSQGKTESGHSQGAGEQGGTSGGAAAVADAECVRRPLGCAPLPPDALAAVCRPPVRCRPPACCPAPLHRAYTHAPPPCAACLPPPAAQLPPRTQDDAHPLRGGRCRRRQEGVSRARGRPPAVHAPLPPLGSTSRGAQWGKPPHAYQAGCAARAPCR